MDDTSSLDTNSSLGDRTSLDTNSSLGDRTSLDTNSIKSNILQSVDDTQYFITSLLEAQNVKCNEFANMLNILIDDFENEINNIHNKIIPINKDKHMQNTKNLILSMYGCINCIIENISSDEIINCNELPKKDVDESDVTNDTTPFVLYDK